MTYQEAKESLEKLQGRMDASFSNSDKKKIEELYFEVLRKTFVRTSCQQCYHDAVIEMMVYLRKNRKLKAKCNYRMRAGFIISCPDFYGGKIYTNDNLTDKVASEYLKQYPRQEVMFSVLPEKEKAEEKFNPDGTPITDPATTDGDDKDDNEGDGTLSADGGGSENGDEHTDGDGKGVSDDNEDE